MSLNKVLLIGRLGADPDLKLTKNQEPFCFFRLATKGNITKSGEQATEWHSVLTFGSTAKACSTHLRKGSEVFLEGSLKTTSFTDSEGYKKYITRVIPSRVLFLQSSKELIHQSNELEISCEETLQEDVSLANDHSEFVS